MLNPMLRKQVDEGLDHVIQRSDDVLLDGLTVPTVRLAQSPSHISGHHREPARKQRGMRPHRPRNSDPSIATGAQALHLGDRHRTLVGVAAVSGGNVAPTATPGLGASASFYKRRRRTLGSE